MTDLKTLFESFLTGEDAAFADLYREVNPRLSAYCWKLAPGHAEDLMQELWERVIGMRSRAGSTAPREVDSPVAFLFRILRNLAIDHHRRGKNEIKLDDDMTDGTYSSYVTQFEQSTDIEALILESFETLSAEDKEILVLNIYSGYKFGEIAEMLGVSNDAVWQRASRARARLRKIVEADAKRLRVALPSTQNIREKEIV